MRESVQAKMRVSVKRILKNVWLSTR
ncbi:MAG: DUF3387 domain-containing protein [Methanobacterium sp.]|nr:DUF3387 domain-containing protein [Methanobacterium sp.]